MGLNMTTTFPLAVAENTKEPVLARDGDSEEFGEVWKAIRSNQELIQQALNTLAMHQLRCDNNQQWIQFYMKALMGSLGLLLLLEIFGGPGALRILFKYWGIVL